MRTRAELQTELETFLGSRNVYFQPPESIKIKYPCIMYNYANPDIDYANNYIYFHMKCYEVTIVDEDPDSELPDKLLYAFQYIKPGRVYPADHLWHFTFKLYY